MNILHKRGDSLAVREVSDGILLLDMDAGQIHQLNAAAGFIWRHCDGVACAGDIAALMAMEYDVQEAVAARDVEMALSELRALKLIGGGR
jgi:hypothetical protein